MGVHSSVPLLDQKRCALPNEPRRRVTRRLEKGPSDGLGMTPALLWLAGPARPPHSQTTTVTQMPEATPQLRVLVIDDSADNAEALCLLLRAMGCLTAVAFSGTQGIAAVAAFDPHLAFIDLEMPGMGGCEVARHLQASRPKGTARLVCLTGRGQPDDRRTCMDAGFDDFFTKPMTPGSLAKVVAESSAAL